MNITHTTVLCMLELRHHSSSGTGRPVQELEHPRSQIGTMPKWGTQCWNWTVQCWSWAGCNFAIRAVSKLGDQFQNWMPSFRTGFHT